MPRQLLRSDIQPGDLMLMRGDCLATLAALDPTRLWCEGIMAGEAVIEAASVTHPPVKYFHVAVVDDPGTSKTLEEETAGEAEVVDGQVDARWDVYRPALSSDQIKPFLDALRARLGTRYALEQYATIAGVRLLHIPPGHPDYTGPAVCSNIVAEALASIGVKPWAALGIDPSDVMPSDFPGDGMRIIAQAGVLVE